jgi:F-type H+-transporting ATPase subunit epsilon
MNTFTLLLHDNTHTDVIKDVTSFVGEDKSGSFGVLANRMRMMTVLIMGLARFKVNQQSWQYIATPGALVYFNENRLIISTRHYLIDNDYMRISAALEEQLLEEESQLQQQKKGLRRMEETVIKRLWELGRNPS